MAVVVIHPYSDDWPRQFDAVRDELRAIFAPLEVAIEHVGSTSILGLSAKPVIDVLLGAPSLAQIEAKITPLGDRGYTYVARYEADLPLRRYFVQSAATALRVHLHAVVTGSSFWQEQLAFRDLLRANAALRTEYQDLKLRLAIQFADNKAAYTDAKGPFIQSVLATLSDNIDGTR